MGKARDWGDVGVEGGPGAIRREGDDPATDIPFDDAPAGQPNGEAYFTEEELPGRSKTPVPIKILTYDEMLAMPEPDFLVFGVVPRRGKTCLFGVSNSFKTFIAVVQTFHRMKYTAQRQKRSSIRFSGFTILKSLPSIA